MQDLLTVPTFGTIFSVRERVTDGLQLLNAFGSQPQSIGGLVGLKTLLAAAAGAIAGSPKYALGPSLYRRSLMPCEGQSLSR